MVTQQPDTEEGGSAELRRELVARARARQPRIRPGDEEDVVQEAMIKTWKEKPGPGAPDLAVRAGKALNDAAVENHRKHTRATVPPDPASLEGLAERDDTEPGRLDGDFALFELKETLRQTVGSDVIDWAEARMANMTEEDLGQETGWTPQRAAAASRQLRRKLDLMAETIGFKLKGSKR